MSEQGWITIVQTVAGVIGGYFAYLSLKAKSDQNGKDISAVHGIVNSQRTVMAAQIDRLTRIIALPSGPDKDRLMAELNLPPEDLSVATREAAAIKASHPATGDQPPHQGGAT
jgi:hypothetical protein